MVLVEDDDLALGGARRGEGVGEHRRSGACTHAGAPAVDRVLAAFHCAGEVLVRPFRCGGGRVGFLYPADDLVVDATAQRGEVGGGRGRVVILGFEVGEYLGVVALAEPEPRVDALVVAVTQRVGARRCGRR